MAAAAYTEHSMASVGGDKPRKLCLSVVILGASGDLATNKTCPALASLMADQGFWPAAVNVVGYGRADMELSSFKDELRGKMKKMDDAVKDRFLERFSYVRGAYDSADDFRRLHQALQEKEDAHPDAAVGRLFYFAVPPEQYGPALTCVKEQCSSIREAEGSWLRLIVEKPFGKDYESSERLNNQLEQLYSEDQVYRIDHYIAKDMTQNMLVTRWANIFLAAIWNRQHIDNVQILLKEDFGTEGRDGYFDTNGIFRDDIQNHVLQILTVVAMERPVSLHPNDIQDEKTKVIRSMRPVRNEDVLLGQYTAGNGKPDYHEDPRVKNDSTTPTFAVVRMHIDNDRWEGVPFVITAGKAMDEKLTEVRIQFKPQPGFLAGEAERMPNEFVMRIEPSEAMFMRMLVKKAGPDLQHLMTDLQLQTEERYQDRPVMGAYPRLILDAIDGNQLQFVRRDELQAAWAVFTPILNAMDEGRGPKLHPYPYNTSGPAEAEEFLARVTGKDAAAPKDRHIPDGDKPVLSHGIPRFPSGKASA